MDYLPIKLREPPSCVFHSAIPFNKCCHYAFRIRASSGSTVLDKHDQGYRSSPSSDSLLLASSPAASRHLINQNAIRSCLSRGFCLLPRDVHKNRAD